MRVLPRILSTVAVLLLGTLFTTMLTTPVAAQQAPQSAVIWHDRGDAALLNLTTGPEGVAGEPGTDFTFLSESTSGTAPKFDVQDEHGVRWKVKLGEEVRTETAAARLLWATGYIVDEDYYRATIHVTGMKPLARGREFVAADGTVTGVRLERYVADVMSATWSWYDNPLVGTREFNGLRVMMALINNWDLKEVNNAASGPAAGPTVYSITDLGATFGRTGDFLKRSKGSLEEYTDARFLGDVTPTHVNLVLHSRPFFPTIVNVSNYRFRSRMEGIVRDIPLDDARWIGDRLARLSAAQIADCFRAGGFSPAEVDGYTKVVLLRIAALQGLPPSIVPAPGEGTGQRPRPVNTVRLAPPRETLTAIPLKTPYARAITGGFEQGGGIGIGAQLSTAEAVPGVEFKATALTSTNRYHRYELDASLPNVGSSRTHADLWFTYLTRDTDFHGVGRDAPDADTTFGIRRRSYHGSLSHDLTDHVEAGVFFQVMNARGVLDNETTRSNILSYGPFLSLDTRDNSDGLTRGANLYGRFAAANGVGSQAVSGSYGWLETEVDARGYLPLGSHRTSLLLRTRGQFKSPRRGHAIPYYDLSWLGGRTFLRGTPSYRLRGNNVLVGSSELQQTVVALKPTRGIDVFAAADAGQLWTSRSEFARDDWRTGVGGGLQYRHSRSMAARVEMSRGDEGTTTYVSLSRGF